MDPGRQALLGPSVLKDRDAQALAAAGGHAGKLMETAAQRSFEFISARGFCRPLILAGPGNNGGDALALVRLLAEQGLSSTCLLWNASRQSEDRIHQYKTVLDLVKTDHLPESGRIALLEIRVQGSRVVLDLPPDAGVSAPAFQALLKDHDLIVDGLYGLGLRGRLEGDAALVVDRLSRACAASGLPVLALDLPSGLHARWKLGEPAFRADFTLCFDHIKDHLYNLEQRKVAGTIVRGDIGITLALDSGSVQTWRLGIPSMLSPPQGMEWQVFDHKYRRGIVDVFAGSREYFGAGLLSARGALAGNPGMVRVHADPELYDAWLGREAALVVQEDMVWGSHGLASETKPGCMVAGPGWGPRDDRKDILEILLDLDRPLVLDAQALRLLPESPRATAGMKRRSILVLTPHLGELANLAGCSVQEAGESTLEMLGLVSQTYSAWVVLKGAIHYVASPDGRIQVLDQPVPSLAMAGSGDVFAGFLASRLALAQARLPQIGDTEKNAGPGDISDWWGSVILHSLALWLGAGTWRASIGGHDTLTGPESLCPFLSKLTLATGDSHAESGIPSFLKGVLGHGPAHKP